VQKLDPLDEPSTAVVSSPLELINMAQKKKKKKTVSKQQSRSVRGQQIVFGIIAVIVIASFVLSLVG
jgi:hypothetical protein